MIRGLNKQVIVVRDTGSDYFEEAIFIVDPSVRAADADLAAEAHRLIAASSGKTPKKHRKRVKWLIPAALLGGALLLSLGYLLAQIL